MAGGSGKNFIDGITAALGGVRDRVVQQSQVGKRKLDATFIRRELDRRLRELGEQYAALAKSGAVAAPESLAGALEAVREAEARLLREEAEIAALKNEK